VIVLNGIVQAIGVLLAKVEGRVEELSAVRNLEAGDDSEILRTDMKGNFRFIRNCNLLPKIT
jgi:hypothetical protein